MAFTYFHNTASYLFQNVGNNDDTVIGVLDGRLDVGFVRTGHVERTVDPLTGYFIDPSLFKVIEPRIYVMDSGFRTARSHFEVRTMQQDAGFIAMNENGAQIQVFKEMLNSFDCTHWYPLLRSHRWLALWKNCFIVQWYFLSRRPVQSSTESVFRAMWSGGSALPRRLCLLLQTLHQAFPSGRLPFRLWFSCRRFI